MRQAHVYVKNVLAGVLVESDDRHYEFVYDDVYFLDNALPSVSLTLPKSVKVHKSDSLFPFFFNMLSEGANRQVQTRTLKIDEDDLFGLLVATAGNDTIGAVTVEEI